MPSNFAAIPIEALLALLTWAIPAIAAVLALKALLPRLLGWAGEARVGARLKRLLPEVRDDLILPDGRGGLTQIDHLALTPAGLLVVETKTYSGLILGQAHEPTWTQVIGRRRHRFQNPLRQNFAHVRAIEALLPDIPVEGRVVFAGQARFANGMPEGVCHAADLADELRSLAGVRVIGGLAGGAVVPPTPDVPVAGGKHDGSPACAAVQPGRRAPRLEPEAVDRSPASGRRRASVRVGLWGASSPPVTGGIDIMRGAATSFDASRVGHGG